MKKLEIRNTTITNNIAERGGGILAGASGVLSFGNTIVAGNTATISFPEINFSDGTITSVGYIWWAIRREIRLTPD